MDIKPEVIKTIVKRYPETLKGLNQRALLIALTGQEPPEFKTVDYYYRALRGLIQAVFNNIMGGEFIDIMANLIQGQLTQAFQFALDEVGSDWFPELQTELDAMIANEYMFVDQLFRDIIDARIDGTGIEPLLARAQIWANRWNDAYNLAKLKIQSLYGERLEWVFGDADHCDTCQRLNGVVAFAREWEALGVRPQNPPNPLLTCQGWRCKCSLRPTDKRRSPNAYERISSIVGRGGLYSPMSGGLPSGNGMGGGFVGSIEDLESEINKNKIETAGVYSQDGKQIFIKDGKESIVEFTKEEVQQMKGAIVTHNHPGGGSFSYPDISLMNKAKIKEMRVITEQYLYTIKDANEAFYKMPEKELSQIFKKAVSVTRITTDEVLEPVVFHDEVIQQFFNFLPFDVKVKYKRIKR